VLRLVGGDDRTRFDVPIPPLQTIADAVIARATAEPAFQCRLYAEVPVILIVEANGAVQSALKRVRLAPAQEVKGTPLAGGYLVNRNPQIETVLAGAQNPDDCTGGGTALVVPCVSSGDCAGEQCRFDASGQGRCDVPLPPGQTALCATSQTGAGGPEFFNQCAPDGTRTVLQESLSWQWYVTAGTIAGTGTVGNATGDHVDLERVAGPFTLWVIVRDGRGGESWERRDFAAIR
jgi:hypothetical protein